MVSCSFLVFFLVQFFSGDYFCPADFPLSFPVVACISCTPIQFCPQISCDAKDKMLYILVLLKLELIQKKVLIFVNSIDSAFKLRLFLEKVKWNHYLTVVNN